MDTKEPKQPRIRAAQGKDKLRAPKMIPADTTMASLARAMWAELKLQPGTKGQLTAEKRAELWKADQKEYKKLARRVAARLGKLADKGKARGRKAQAGL